MNALRRTANLGKKYSDSCTVDLRKRIFSCPHEALVDGTLVLFGTPASCLGGCKKKEYTKPKRQLQLQHNLFLFQNIGFKISHQY